MAEPVGLVLGVGVPVMLLVIFGLSSGFEKRIVATSPTTLSDRVRPDPDLARARADRADQPADPDRRAARAQVPPATVHHPGRRRLAAGGAGRVNLVLALVAMVLIVAGDALFFGVHAPSQVPGFISPCSSPRPRLFAIGLVIAAVAPSERAAGAIGSALSSR